MLFHERNKEYLKTVNDSCKEDDEALSSLSRYPDSLMRLPSLQLLSDIT